MPSGSMSIGAVVEAKDPAIIVLGEHEWTLASSMKYQGFQVYRDSCTQRHSNEPIMMSVQAR
eukprot:scaffold630463_cov20-Prasinocladus_malaysianus.AAC.1